jgi:hypothetical protein
VNSARHFHHTKSYAARNNFLHTIVTKTNLASLHMTLRPLIFWVACPIHQSAARVMGSQYTNWTRVWGSEICRWKLQAYLINTRTHCRTPATPVQTEGPLFVRASCTNKPTDAARQTKETTYATKSQSFTLQYKETKVKIFYAGITGKILLTP